MSLNKLQLVFYQPAEDRLLSGAGGMLLQVRELPDSTALSLLPIIFYLQLMLNEQLKCSLGNTLNIASLLGNQKCLQTALPIIFYSLLFSYNLVAPKPQCSGFCGGTFYSSQIIQDILKSTAIFCLPFLSSELFPFTDLIISSQ